MKTFRPILSALISAVALKGVASETAMGKGQISSLSSTDFPKRFSHNSFYFLNEPVSDMSFSSLINHFPLVT